MNNMQKIKTIEIVLILISILFAGTSIFMAVEGWHFIDALYFATATLTTVGFGDVVPHTLLGKFFGVLYMWIGVTVAVYSIAYIGSHIISGQLEGDQHVGFRFFRRHKKKTD